MAPAEDAVATVMSIAARDGFPLALTVVEPSHGDVRGQVLIAPATAVAGTFYRPFACYLAAHGLRVVIVDYRGVGMSRPQAFRGPRLRALNAGFGTWARLDVSAAWDVLVARGRDLPTAYVGHSLGGQFFPLVQQAGAAGAVMLVAAQVGWVGHWMKLPTLPKYVGLMGALGATSVALGFGPGRLFGGEDLPRRAASDWVRWGLHPRYLAGWHAEASSRAGAITAPVACVSFADDHDFAPPPAARALAAWYPRAQLATREFSPTECGGRPIGHFGFFRREPGGALWPWAADWLMEALGLRREDTPPPEGSHGRNA